MPRPSSLSFWAAYEYLATTHLDRMSLADQNTLAGLCGIGLLGLESGWSPRSPPRPPTSALG